MNRIALTPDEIRTATMIINQYKAAMVRAQMAQEMEVEYMELLRAKYGLEDSWVCRDVLTGFEREEGKE